MNKGLGRVAISGIAAAALAVAGLAGVAAAGMTGDAARRAGATAGAEAVAAAETAQTASWYGRGMAELAVGETAQNLDRTATQVMEKATDGSEEPPPTARPVGGLLDEVSRTGAEAERVMVDTARAAAATIADGADRAATTLDTTEESLRR